MSVIDRILAVLTPYECLNCTIEGDLLCNACIQQLITVPAQCTVSGNLWRLQAGTAYTGVAKELVARLKFAGAQAAAKPMVTKLSLFIDNPGLVIVPVPTATSRVRGRGYDQAKLLARELSRETRLPYLDCLVRSGQTHQVGSSRQQRLHQLSTAFRVKDPRRVQGNHIVLVDDVVTTGATLETAAGFLKMEGAASVEAVVFAQA